MHPDALIPRSHRALFSVLVVLFLFLLLLSPPVPAFAQPGGTATVSSLEFPLHSPQSGDLKEYYLSRIRYNEGCFPGQTSPSNGKIFLSPDGSLAGDCLYQTGSGDNYEKITGTFEGKVTGKQIEFKTTSVRDYAGPMQITDRDHKVIGSFTGTGHIVLTYQASGTFTSANRAQGDAVFEFSCTAEQKNLQGQVPYGVENQCPGSTADPQKVSRTDSGSMEGTTTFVIQFENAPSHLPLIFVPGVGGSMLELEGVGINPDLWPTAVLGSRTNLMLEADGVTPAVQGAKVIARDIIRYDNTYGPLMAALAARGYKEKGDDADLFIFPYDWRLDNTIQVAALARLVDGVLRRTGSPKVNILTHSMGGLIARAYVNTLANGKVDTLVTMSMPLYGSPKVLYALVSGYTFGNITVRQPLMKILSQNWPAVYQLLGRKPFIVDDAAGKLMPVDTWKRLRYRGFVSAYEGAPEYLLLRDEYHETQDNPWSPNPTLVQNADAFHRMLVDPATGQEKPLPTGVKHYAISGYGVSTIAFWRLKDCTPGTSWIPGVSDTTCLQLDGQNVKLEPIFLDGDGVVPVWGLNVTSATKRYLFPYLDSSHSGEHTAITGYPQVLDLVQDLYRGQAPAVDKLPIPEERLDPNRWLYFFQRTDFTLHSDADLTVIDERTGARLGSNDSGGIDESLTTGSFLSTQGTEYISIADVQGSYRVQVKGIQDGSFHLTVDMAQGSQTTTFTYGPVPVKKGTVAEVRITPSQVGANLPPMEVTTGGTKTTRPPVPGPAVPPTVGGNASVPNTPPAGSQPVPAAGSSTATSRIGLTEVAAFATCLLLLAGGVLFGIVLVTRRQSRVPVAPPARWSERPTDVPESRHRGARPTDLPR